MKKFEKTNSVVRMSPKKQQCWCLLWWLLLCLFVFLFLSTTEAVRIVPSARSSSLEGDGGGGGDGDGGEGGDGHGHGRLLEIPPVASSPDDHLVTELPLLYNNNFPTSHWAGLLPASKDDDKFLFYWLFAPDDDTSQYTKDNIDEGDIPLIVWLNGGPGCSSMDGLFIENGPFRFELSDDKDPNSDWILTRDVLYSWHHLPAYVVYIDQPVGTGLSYTTNSKKYPTNDLEVNQDFYYFFQQFLKLHADKFLTEDLQRMRRGVYFTGESHAGHYIPSMMSYILDQNDFLKDKDTFHGDPTTVHIHLHGAAIGNGWMDPFHQYAAAEAAYGHGIIGKAQLTALQQKEKECQNKLNQNQYSEPVCFQLLDLIIAQSHGISDTYKASQYDVRKVEPRSKSRTFPLGHRTVEAYLGGKTTGPEGGTMPPNTFQDVLEAIHATPGRNSGQNYQECTDPPYDALAHQDGLGVVRDVVRILEHASDPDNRIRLLFFNGIEDLICNHVGNEVFLEQMEWTKQREYIESPRYAWRSPYEKQDGKISGYMKEYNNHLLFLKLMDSGHMVPMDIPHVALSMMQQFIFSRKDKDRSYFATSKQDMPASAQTDYDNCPVCPKNDYYDSGEIIACNGTVTSLNINPNNNHKKNGTKIIAYTWIGAFIVVSILVFLFFKDKFYSTRFLGGGGPMTAGAASGINRRSWADPIYNLRQYSSSPQYDFELREGIAGASPSHGLYRDHAESLSSRTATATTTNNSSSKQTTSSSSPAASSSSSSPSPSQPQSQSSSSRPVENNKQQYDQTSLPSPMGTMNRNKIV